MKKSAAADVVIFGGGVAGLWMLNRIRQQGLSAILFESNALGGGQTHKAQGIIHGGMKYALQGLLTDEARAMAEMPARWQACLEGKGELNLSGVNVLSNKQYLWAPHKFTSKLTGFLAGATLSSKVDSLPQSEYPAVFQHPRFRGDVFALDEIVLDVTSLIRELVKANQDVIFQIEPLCDEELKWDESGNLTSATVYMNGAAVDIQAQQFIFAAGAGNELISKKYKKQEVAMQRRPLHMVLAKMPKHESLYAHCLGLGSRPRITITTHTLQDGHTVWYLGGLLAEEGVARDSASQIYAARLELQDLFPWLDIHAIEFSTFMIDRAEPLQKGFAKPDKSYMKALQNLIIAWPTKLALAPQLASDVLQHFQHIALTPQLLDVRELRAWPMPPLAIPVWEEAFSKTKTLV